MAQSPLLHSVEVTLAEAIDTIRGVALLLDEAGDQARAAGLGKEISFALLTEGHDLDAIERALGHAIDRVSSIDKQIAERR